MNREIKAWWLGLSLLLFLAFGQIGCASSEAEPECETDFECSFTETCNTELGVCEAEIRDDNNQTTNNDTPDTSIDPTDTGNGDEDDEDTSDNNETDVAPIDTGNDTTDPNVCDPACSAGERCESGTCVPDSAEPTCTRKGDSCDPEVVDQGSFWCAGDGNGGGECLPKCSETLTAEGCGLAEYCWNLGSETSPAPACIESECQSDGDCTSGTCINFDNQFGLCVPSGSTPEGGACDPSAANTCAPGLMCLSDASGSTTGVCRTLCDPWTSSSCPGGQLCSLYTTREGICSPDVDATGSSAFASCSTSGDMCGHGLPCIGFADGSNACIPYCREGMADCPSTAPNGAPIVCNNYVLAGERTWGLCLGACSVDADCGTGSLCRNNICRTTCTAGNEVQDCCGGNPDCDWSCVNGLCE